MDPEEIEAKLRELGEEIEILKDEALKNNKDGNKLSFPLSPLDFKVIKDSLVGFIRETHGGNEDGIKIHPDGNSANATAMIEFWTDGGDAASIYIDKTTAELIIDAALAATFSGDIYPTITNSSDIGEDSTPRRFKTIYLINSPDVSSSRKEKRDIKAIKYGLGDILKMNPVSFRRKDSNEDIATLGFIAEELTQISPEVASEKSYKPEHLIPILVRSIQQLNDKIDNK